MRTIPAFSGPGTLRYAVEAPGLEHLSLTQQALMTGKLGKPMRSVPQPEMDQFAGSERINLYRCVHSQPSKLKPLHDLGATRSDLGDLLPDVTLRPPSVAFSVGDIAEVTLGG